MGVSRTGQVAAGGGGGGGGSSSNIDQGKDKANKLLDIKKCADFILQVLQHLPGINPAAVTIDQFKKDFDALSIVPTPAGDKWVKQNGSRYTAHVDDLGQSSSVHVDHPERDNLPETLLHETFHTIFFGASDQEIAKAAGIPGADKMSMKDASDAFSKEISKYCNPGDLKK